MQFTLQITNKQQQTKTPTINPKGKNVWRDKCHINNDFLMSRFTNPIWFPKSPQTSHCSRGPAQGSGKKYDTVNRGRRQAASTKGPLRQGEGRTRAQGHPWSLKGPHTPRGGFFFPNRPWHDPWDIKKKFPPPLQSKMDFQANFPRDFWVCKTTPHLALNYNFGNTWIR